MPHTSPRCPRPCAHPTPTPPPSQGTIKHTLMAQSPAGTQADVDIARGLYEEGWWLEALIAEDLDAIGHRQFFSHK